MIHALYITLNKEPPYSPFYAYFRGIYPHLLKQGILLHELPASKFVSVPFLGVRALGKFLVKMKIMGGVWLSIKARQFESIMAYHSFHGDQFDVFISNSVLSFDVAPKKPRILIVRGALWRELNRTYVGLSESGFGSIFIDHEKKAYLEADQIVIVDSALIPYVKSFVPDAEPIHIPSGIDVNLFRYRAKDYCRKYLGLPLNKKIVMYCSGMKWWKAPDFIADVFAYMAKRRGDLLFLIVGNGPYLRLVKKKLRGCSVVFTGNVVNDKMPFYYGAADLICNALRATGYSRVSMEATSCGRPLLVTPSGCIYPLRNGKNCFRAEFDVQKYAEKALELLRKDLSSVEKAARRTAIECFSIEFVAEKMGALIKELL